MKTTGTKKHCVKSFLLLAALFCAAGAPVMAQQSTLLDGEPAVEALATADDSVTGPMTDEEIDRILEESRLRYQITASHYSSSREQFDASLKRAIDALEKWYASPEGRKLTASAPRESKPAPKRKPALQPTPVREQTDVIRDSWSRSASRAVESIRRGDQSDRTISPTVVPQQASLPDQITGRSSGRQTASSLDRATLTAATAPPSPRCPCCLQQR